jgi:hypothetical protein
VSEIEITLPTVQYGNVKVRATPEAFGLVTMADAYELGVAAAVYLNLFSQGFKAGSQMDVSAPQGASREAAPGDPQAAADRLAEGRPPHTVDEANEMATQVIKDALGATEMEESAPWDKPAAEVKKPWETESGAPMTALGLSDW